VPPPGKMLYGLDVSGCTMYIRYSSVADPVGSGNFWSDPDPDVWDRIRILALINDAI
jgi:hypothetical protein